MVELRKIRPRIYSPTKIHHCGTFNYYTPIRQKMTVTRQPIEHFSPMSYHKDYGKIWPIEYCLLPP